MNQYLVVPGYISSDVLSDLHLDVLDFIEPYKYEDLKDGQKPRKRKKSLFPIEKNIFMLSTSVVGESALADKTDGVLNTFMSDKFTGLFVDFLF